MYNQNISLSQVKEFETAQNLIKAFADPCDDIIYHYTSAEGLMGIIENNEIWLTNTAFVNDTSECKALKQDFKDQEILNFTNNDVKDMWKKLVCDPYYVFTDEDTYIASFSNDRESLAQWRAYGYFRIGFKTKTLKNRNFNLYQCVYSEDEIKRWILEKEQVEEWQGVCKNDYKSLAAFNLIYAASRKYKNKHFQDEQEVRLMAVSHHSWEPYANSTAMYRNDPPIHYRIHPAYKMPVPYVKFFIEDNEDQKRTSLAESQETSVQIKARKLREEKNKGRLLLPITEILIGPMTHQDKAKTACKILLKDRGYENVEIKKSDIPYRGF